MKNQTKINLHQKAAIFFLSIIVFAIKNRLTRFWRLGQPE
jgi:hypothetical protein